MGFDPLLSRRPRHRRPHDKRPFGDSSRKAFVQTCLQRTPVSDPSGRLLRVAKNERWQATLLYSEKKGRPFAFAGLWESWVGDGEGEIHSCSILATDANELVGEAHHRMPVILPHEDYDLWLDPDVREPEELLPHLAPYPGVEMQA